MKLFSNLFRNKKSEEDRKIHNEDIVDIPVYGPHDNILPVPYEASGFFAGFEADFETLCREFLSKTSLDKYNKGYMDSLIIQMVKEAMGLLDVQERGHANVINQLARTRASDINDAEIRLEQVLSEKKAVMSNIRQLEAIYYSGTAFEATERGVE